MHSISQGALEGLQGGDIIHGLVSGATSSLGGKLINDNLSSIGKVGEVAANSILSGTIDEIGGGKFANGAVTGAFNILFNDLMHDERQIEIKEENDFDDEYKLAGALAITGTAMITDDITGIGILDDPLAGAFYVASGQCILMQQ